jgi:hypothetical protein
VLKGGSGSSTTTAPPAGTFDPASYQAGFAQGANYNIIGPQGAPGQAGPAGPAGADAGQATDITVSRPGIRWPIAPVRSPGGVSSPLRGQPVRYGAGGGRSDSIGSRSADDHAYFHPSMKQPPLYPHFVRGGVGGAAAPHQVAVHNIAHAAGIHPARLLALNGRRPQKYIRIA